MEYIERLILIAILCLIIWNGIEIKIGKLFSYELYPFKRFFKKKMNKTNEVYKIANNALYFNDNSDYKTALWEILSTLNPDLEEETELKFIDD